MAMVAIFYFLLFVDVDVPWKKPKWNRTNQYFRCNGVKRGVATGNTWPVPGCFTSLTDDLFIVERIRLKILAGQDAILPLEGIISLLILLATLLGAYYYLNYQDQMDLHQKEKLIVDHEKGLKHSLLVKNHHLPQDTPSSTGFDSIKANIY
jgi:hypothetical protein